MNEEKPIFKSGEKVRIKGQGIIQYGEVISTLTISTGSELREIVWVKLADGKVEGLNPRKLEKMQSVPKQRAV